MVTKPKKQVSQQEESRRPMSREEAGRLGAEARWGHHPPRERRYAHARRPMSHSEAGRLGAEARWGGRASQHR